MKPPIYLDYLDYTQNWQDVFVKQNASQISRYLNSGFSFSISREEYNKMNRENENKQPKYIYYYFGLKNDKLVILVTDDVSDADGKYENIFVKELDNSIHPIGENTINTEEYKIPHIEALNRAFVWKMLSTNWIGNRFATHSDDVDSGGVPFFPLIRNSFQDLNIIFEDESCDHAYHFFGLQHEGLGSEGNKIKETTPTNPFYSKHTLDIIISNIYTSLKETHNVNVSWPVGLPFSKTDLETLHETQHSLLPKGA